MAVLEHGTLDSHHHVPAPSVRHISLAEVFEALGRGAADFWARPTHHIVLFIIYPVMGFVLAAWTSGSNAFHLLFPLAAGFALLGPVVGIGLYEISRRREAGLDTSPSQIFKLLRSPALGSIIILGILLAATFLAWLFAAQAIYQAYFGAEVPASFGGMIGDILTTSRGWNLIMVGVGVGFLFALFVLATTVVAFPMLVDRGGSAWAAIMTSVRVTLANPIPVLAWGLIVAIALFVGSLPLFVGLALVLPILGHATWHLYRATVL